MIDKKLVGVLSSKIEPKSNFNDFYYFKKAFTDEMIDKTNSMLYDGK